jgi:hypothetical protein
MSLIFYGTDINNSMHIVVEEDKKMALRVKCKNKKCEYEWDYQGISRFWATCPRCLRKIRVDNLPSVNN